MFLRFYYFFWLIFSWTSYYFKCCNSFALSRVDKVTTGTQSFVSVIAIIVCGFSAVLEAITDSLE